jgi:tetratricopeptide (TPR) repeat protein
LEEHQSAELYLWRAFFHEKAGDSDDARIYADKALLVEPDMATRLFEEGNNFYYRREYDKSIVCYDKAILLNLISQMRSLTKVFRCITRENLIMQLKITI